MSDEEELPHYRWVAPFIAGLRQGLSVEAAAIWAEISAVRVYKVRKENARFAREWDGALAAAKGMVSVQATHWRKPFLEALAETSNVRAAAAHAGVPASHAYKVRRNDPAFAARWLAALHEGYDNLELELLCYLRNPKPEQKMEVAVAMRLLAAHREAVARHRALIEEEDDEAILISLNTFLEGMRQRRFANQAILIPPSDGDGAQ